MYGPFNTDTKALVKRADLNSNNSRYDLESWIVTQLSFKPAMKILDLGCGTGRQLLAFSSCVDSDSKIYGLDISPAAVEEAKKLVSKDARIHTIQGSFDEEIEGRYDLITSTYAIYYSGNLSRVMALLRSNLCHDGKIFICGPGEGTNKEFIELVNKVQPSSLNAIPDFIGPEILETLGRVYKNHRVTRLYNLITFQSPQQLMQWWSNHNSYIPSLHEKVEASVDGSFEVTKNVLGVLFYA